MGALGNLVLLENVFFQAFKVLLAGLLVGDGEDVLICLAKGRESEFCVGKCLAHVSDSLPVEILLILVLELHRGIDVEVLEDSHPHRIAVFVRKSVESFDHIDLDLEFRSFRHIGQQKVGRIGPASERDGSEEEDQYQS